jgi:hypothetical protein
LPGSIQNLASFSRIAIILLIVLVQHGYGQYRWLLYLVVGEEAILALSTFSKQAVIELLIAIGLGWYLGRPQLRGLLVGAVAVVLLYVFFLSTFMSFGRIAFSAVGAGSAAEVVEAVGIYGVTQREDLAGFIPGVQSWWTRFSYANAQAYAIDAYDKGAKGDSVSLAIYALLPRLIVPDKPLLTPGREFTAVVTGQETETATAPGIFAEAYWNGGWTAVACVCVYVGLVFAGLTTFSKRAIASAKYEYLAVIMPSLAMGYSPNDWFAAVYVGTLANILVLYFLMRFVAAPLIRAPNKSAASRVLTR